VVVALNLVVFLGIAVVGVVAGVIAGQFLLAT
jgi:hypothetical protein